jgi:uncharacterized protein
MDPIRIIKKYYPPESLCFRVLLFHSQAVARMAVDKAKHLDINGSDIDFIQEAAMLHDIGISYTSAPEIGCFGDLPYLCHGYMGHNLLLTEGLPRHALVCERHTGTGLTLADIRQLDGLLPERPMEPISLAEKLIAYCDKFFSKDPMHLEEELPFETVLEGILRFGNEKGKIFTQWHSLFNP